MQLHPHLDTVVLKGFTRAELEATLRSCQFYIDFGHHPGKDRLPREAARAGCIVFVRRQGAAANATDVLLPDDRRFDCSKGGLLELGRRLTQAAASPGVALDDQRPYLDLIEHERSTFDGEVRSALRCLFDADDARPDARSIGAARVTA